MIAKHSLRIGFSCAKLRRHLMPTKATIGIFIFLLFAAPLLSQQANVFTDPGFSEANTKPGENPWDALSPDNELSLTSSKSCPFPQLKDSQLEMKPILFGPSVALHDVTGDGVPDIVGATINDQFWVYKNFGTPQAPKWKYGGILPVNIFDENRWTDLPTEKGDKIKKADVVNVPRISLAPWSNEENADIIAGTLYGEIFVIPLVKSEGKVGVASKTIQQMEIVSATGQAKEGSAVLKSERKASDIQFWGNLFAPWVTDWNKDKVRDIIIGEGTFAANNVWLLAGPAFDSSKRKLLAVGGGRMRIIPASTDWDNDGNPDILACDSDGEVWVYLNKEGNKDAKKPLSAAPFACGLKLDPNSSFSIGDLNGDGLFDILSGSPKGIISAAINQGTQGAPSFSKIEPLKGEPRFPAIKTPKNWGLKPKEHSVNYLLELVNDTSNTGSGRTGGDCLKFHFFKNESEWIIEALVPTSTLGSISKTFKADHTVSCKQKKLQVTPNTNYQLSFWVKASGFSGAQWVLSANLSETGEPIDNRRGEAVKGATIKIYGEKFDGEIPVSGSWVQVSAPIQVKGDTLKDPITCKFSVGLVGKGEFYLDDISLVPSK